MKTLSLYPLVLLCVLGLACGAPAEEARPAVDTTRTADANADAPAPGETRPAVLVLGNSLAAGYGLDPDEAFPALLQARIDSLGWNFEVINAGLSGETTAGGLRRIDWLLRRPVDVLILELGGNDGLRGISPEVTAENLAAIITRTRERFPTAEVILAGMQIPPNLGQEYTRRFREVYPEVSRQKGAHLIPFLLEGVGGVASLMQADGIHPTAAGQRIVAQNVWKVLEPVLRARIEAA